MNSITQEDPYGCSLACIAFLTNKSYPGIASLISKQRAENEGFYCKELVKLLKDLRYEYQYKYLKNRFKKYTYNDGVIVFIKRSKKYPSGHYLARRNGLWMDPWINFKIGAKIENAKSGFRKRLPGKAIYGIFPKNILSV
jgi:hypothetical protein